MSVAAAFAEFAAWAEPAIAGWRYLFSSAYRTRKHEDWRHEHVGYVVLDFLGGIVGVAICVGMIVILCAAILAWWQADR
jgi:hypothetical protein